MNTTKEISHQYDQIVHALLPGLQIHIVYDCESQITYDENGDEESNLLTKITCTVKGAPADVISRRRNTGKTPAYFLPYCANPREMRCMRRRCGTMSLNCWRFTTKAL